jgi:hypothetical protein
MMGNLLTEDLTPLIFGGYNGDIEGFPVGTVKYFVSKVEK